VFARANLAIESGTALKIRKSLIKLLRYLRGRTDRGSFCAGTSTLEYWAYGTGSQWWTDEPHT